MCKASTKSLQDKIIFYNQIILVNKKGLSVEIKKYKHENFLYTATFYWGKNYLCM